MAGKISSENTFAHDFSKKLRSRLVSRRLRSNMDNCWLPLALYDIFRHHPVFIYIISNLKYCVTPPFDLNVSNFDTNLFAALCQQILYRFEVRPPFSRQRLSLVSSPA